MPAYPIVTIAGIGDPPSGQWPAPTSAGLVKGGLLSPPVSPGPNPTANVTDMAVYNSARIAWGWGQTSGVIKGALVGAVLVGVFAWFVEDRRRCVWKK